MSFSEIKKTLNTNFDEPLNYVNYIDDITTFGVDSYILSTHNEDIWRNFICNSSVLYTVTSIHEIIVNRLTDEDVDHMIRNNAKLGQCLNKFYNTNIFPSGNIEAIYSDITTEMMNILDQNIASGLQRYIDSKSV